MALRVTPSAGPRMNKNERSNHAEQPRKRCVDDGSRKEFDQVLEDLISTKVV